MEEKIYETRAAPEKVRPDNIKEIKLPNYVKITEKCVKEMLIKFKNYGNNWVNLDDLYWKERILKECKEYNESMTIDSEKRKLLNILNMVAMAYETADTNRGCRQHIVDFKYIKMSEFKPWFVNCKICGKSLVINEGIIREDGEIE